MKILSLHLLFWICLFQLNSSVFAQTKIGIDIAPTVRFLNPGTTDFKGQNYFAMAGGLRSEIEISPVWWFEFGADVTYYSSTEKVTEQFGDCLNCLVIAPRPFPGSIGSKKRYVEIDLPILIKRQLLSGNRTMLKAFTGYSPSWELPSTHIVYYPNGEDHFKQKYRTPGHFFISLHAGLELQFEVNERIVAGTSIAYRHRFINENNVSLRANQYRIHFKVLYEI